MKAEDLEKVSLTKEEIYKGIEQDLKNYKNVYIHLIPYNIYVSPEVQASLIADGFKLGRNNMYDLIVEW